MLFSLFFGAGNLIFPPLLGLEAGSNFTVAITGFLITGVVLPFMAIMAIAISDGGLLAIGNRVHPIFGLIFAIIVYLSIGAFYGIPRASNVAYELGFKQLFAVDSSGALFIFSLLFFGLTYYISFNPEKIVNRIGQILTPILLLVLAILFIQAFRMFDMLPAEPTGDYLVNPFISGFLEGYFTMDAIAALAFGIVVINGLRDKGAATRQEIIRGSMWAGIIAGIALTIVYFCLGWIGRYMPTGGAYENGAEILTASSSILFAQGGSLLFGAIVILACLTTCVGLINACSQFFNEVFPKFTYQTYVLIFVVIGLLVSNLGLTLILQLATPLLVFIYPLAIVLIMLTLFQYVFGGGRRMYQFAIIITALYAIYDVLVLFEIEVPVIETILHVSPFLEHGLGWVVPAFIAAMLGFTLDRMRST